MFACVPFEGKRVRRVIHVRPFIFLVQDHLAIALPDDVGMLRVNRRRFAIDLGVHHQAVLSGLRDLVGVTGRSRLIVRVAFRVLGAVGREEIAPLHQAGGHHYRIHRHGLIDGGHGRRNKLFQPHG